MSIVLLLAIAVISMFLGYVVGRFSNPTEIVVEDRTNDTYDQAVDKATEQFKRVKERRKAVQK